MVIPNSEKQNKTKISLLLQMPVCHSFLTLLVVVSSTVQVNALEGTVKVRQPHSTVVLAMYQLDLLQPLVRVMNSGQPNLNGQVKMSKYFI